MPPSDHIVENEADNSSGNIVDGGGWRHVSGTSENDGHVDVLPE